MANCRTILSFIGICLTVFWLPAQNNFPFSVNYYGVESGLTQNQVMDFVQKKDGSFLVCTANSIKQFNGTHFVDFMPNGGYTRACYLDLIYHEEDSSLYGRTVDHSYERIYPHPRQITLFRSVCVDPEHPGRLAGIQPDGRVVIGNYDLSVKYRTFQTSFTDARLIAISGETVLIADSQALYSVNILTREKRLLIRGVFNKIRSNPFGGGFLALTNSRCYLLSTELDARQILLPIQPSDNDFTFQLQDIIATDTGAFLITSSHGLFQVADEHVVLYTKKDGLKVEQLYTIGMDPQSGVHFIGTSSAGIMTLQPYPYTTLRFPDDLSDQSYNSIVYLKGSTYATTFNGELVRIRGDSIKVIARSRHPFSSLNVLNDTLYAGRWSESLFQYLPDGRKLKDIGIREVLACIQDSKGTIWVGTAHQLFRGPSLYNLSPVPVPKGQFTSIYELRNGVVCVGGDCGALSIHPDGSIQPFFSDKQEVYPIRSFYEDSEGKIWMGSKNGGLFCWYQDSLYALNQMPNCVLGPDIFTLARAKNGYIYCSSNNGVVMVHEGKLNDFFYGRIPYLIPFHDNFNSGMLNSEFNGGFQNNFLLTPDEELYFPSIQGIVKHKPSRFVTDRLQPKFADVILNDSISALKTHTFARSTHSVEFTYYCTNFQERRNIYFQYRLLGDGLSGNWSHLKKRGYTQYKMLPPGDYIFQVRAIDGFNDSNPVISEYVFSITPYFYETAFFKGLVVFLITVVIFLSVHMRIRAIKRRERDRSDQKQKMLELKLNAIQAKMTPHFMFNALNGILYQLGERKYDEAEGALEDFALLLRKTLVNSSLVFIKIREELHMINLYLSLQQQRFKSKLSYSIQCDEALNDLEIPTMMIQPFVENAIIHGVSHSKQPCTIAIEVRSYESGVDIKIIDDGVGRNRSAEINKYRKSHKSYGMEIVREKISSMYAQYKIPISLSITDLSEEKGTIVELKIPYI